MRFVRPFLFALVVVCMVFVACSSDPKTVSAPEAAPATAAPKTPTLYTAQQALAAMQGYAQKQWAYDALPIEISSEVTSEGNGKDGKSAVWKGVFASASRGTVRRFVYSGSRLPEAPPSGVSAAPELTATDDLTAGVFQDFLLKTDSDKAFAIAQKNGGEAVMKKFPEEPVNYVGLLDRKMHAPMWYVVYGSDIKKNKGFGVINGLTGNFVRGGKGSS